ncbi:helix-turn-helix domain-containing protein [Paenibacillus sp. J5C_2022]|uniref:helix-turn-helix domain-containing protein n=1 Tax=Paenibacillus sp. J5C2022 TaxID=2977129 RepID=UPI0021D1F9DE|nr:helix-turn-helix domain-containing protein [Paenibacillus sp. J5C2022]MCU6713094.1 helix-turn-helix domain-containing protein [Paenibacillus sp. J5C2022]
MLHILIVDRDKAVRSALKEFVERSGHVVIGTTDTEEEACSLMLERGWPNVLITDILEGELGGLKLVEKIGELLLPVESIVIGGSSHHAHIRTAMRSGAIDYLVKPVDWTELQAALKQAESNILEGLERHRYTHRIRYYFDALQRMTPEEVIGEQRDLLLSILRLREKVKGERRGLLYMLSAQWFHRLRVHGLAYDPPPFFQRPTEALHYFRGMAEFWVRQTTEPARTSYESTMTKVCDYLHEFHHEPVALAKVCERFGMSPSYFSKRFKEHTGMTFVQYVQELRIERAKEMLIGSDKLIYEVAESCGFATLQYFNRLFKQETGMTPREYKRSLHI